MDLNTLTVVGTIAASSFGLGVYISTLKADLKDALIAHKEEDAEKFHDHATRLQILELKSSGWTHSGKNPDAMDLKF